MNKRNAKKVFVAIEKAVLNIIKLISKSFILFSLIKSY